MTFYNQTIKVCMKMAEQMKRQDLAQKLNKFINDKQTKEVFLGQLPDQQ